MATIHWSGDAKALIVEIPEENTESHAGVIAVLREALDILGWDVIAVRGNAPSLTITPVATDSLKHTEAVAVVIHRALTLRGVVVE